MTNEEKINFINEQKLKNKPNLFFIITSILLWISFAFWVLVILISIITFEFEILEIIVSVLMLTISFIFGKKSNATISKSKNLIKRILNENMYIF